MGKEQKAVAKKAKFGSHFAQTVKFSEFGYCFDDNDERLWNDRFENYDEESLKFL